MNFDIKKIYTHPIVGVLIIIAFTIILLSIPISNTHKDLNNLISIGNTISKINSDDNLNDSEITSNVYINSLEKKISDLESINITLKDINLNNKNINILDNMKSGLNYNILLYKKLVDMLQTPSAKNLYNSYSESLVLMQECEETYLSCQKDNIPLYLKSNDNNYLNNILFYLNQIIKLDRDSDIKISQRNDLVVSIDRLHRDFIPLMEDLLTLVDTIKNDNRNINILLPDVQEKINKFEILKNQLYLIPIPENSNKVFYSLEDIFYCYESYINSFSNALLNDINSNNDNTDFYELARNEYLRTKNLITIFDEEFTNYKNDY